MKNVLVIALALLVTTGCSKKKPAELVVPVEPIVQDLPLTAGRNIDSLSHGGYAPRLLAFSIELGHRSADFNKRLGLLIASMTPDVDWRTAVKERLAAENYRAAEQYNLAYLDSLSRLLEHPPKALAGSRSELLASHQRLMANYDVLRNYEKFPTMSAILDTVLANELVINRSLNDFRAFLEKYDNPVPAN